MQRCVWSLIITILVVVALPSSSVAEDFGPVAVVNVKKILRESKVTKNIQEQIEKKRKELQAKVSKEEESLREKNQKLAEQRSVLSPEAFTEKSKTFREEVAKAQQSVQEERSKLEKGYGTALKEVQKVVQSIIAELASKKGFSIAIPAEQILHHNTELDISNEVLETLDKRLPKLKVDVK